MPFSLQVLHFFLLDLSYSKLFFSPIILPFLHKLNSFLIIWFELIRPFFHSIFDDSVLFLLLFLKLSNLLVSFLHKLFPCLPISIFRFKCFFIQILYFPLKDQFFYFYITFKNQLFLIIVGDGLWIDFQISCTKRCTDIFLTGEGLESEWFQLIIILLCVFFENVVEVFFCELMWHNNIFILSTNHEEE